MNSQLVREESSCLKQTRRLRQSEGGYILLAATAIVAVLLGTGLAFMRWSTDESMQSHHVSAAIEAYYLAQMGVVEQGYQWLRNRDAGDLPVAEVSLPDRTVPGYGRYKEVKILPTSLGDGDFWMQNRRYRISAVGVVTLPWYDQGRTDPKEVERRAVLYVKVRSFSDYMYLSDQEMTNFGDRIKFWGEDTLDGRVHSNSQIAIMENPVFYDQVTQAGPEDDFWHGNGYNPQFRGPDPIFHAVPVDIPQVAENLRAHAGGHYYSPGINKQMRCRIVNSSVTLWTWDIGDAFDSTSQETVREDFGITDNMCLFTETPLELYGSNIQGRITIGSAQVVRLVDDVYVAPPWDGGSPNIGDIRVSLSNQNYVGIVSEGQIKIANTPANGRENSNGLGFGQSNPAFTDIIITAAVVALGESFTFENQNDPDSGYVCNCNPDDRGTIWLWGSLTQQRRGYVHRSNNSSTGYAKQYRYDKRFLKERPPCFFNAVDSTGHALFDIVQWGQGVPQPNVPLVRYN